MIIGVKSTWWAGAVVAVAAVVAFRGDVAASAPSDSQAAAKQAASEAVKRGEYLVKGVGCGDCHTPHKLGPEGPEPDESLLLSGHPASMALPKPPQAAGPWIMSASGTLTAWAGPWGISYSANLTPHEAGLGTWTEQQFVDALRSGRHQGRGRPILPPMPWPAFANLTDDDLKAIFAYLQSIKPIANKVPDPVIAEPPAKP